MTTVAVLTLVLTLLECLHEGLSQSASVIDGPGYAKAVCDEVTYTLRHLSSKSLPDVANQAFSADSPDYDGTISLTGMTLSGFDSGIGQDFITQRQDDAINESGNYRFPSLQLQGSLSYTYQTTTVQATFVLTLPNANLAVSVNITIEYMDLKMAAVFTPTETGVLTLQGLTTADQDNIDNNGNNYIPAMTNAIQTIAISALNNIIQPEVTCFNANAKDENYECTSTIYTS